LVRGRPDIGLSYSPHLDWSLRAIKTKNIWSYLKVIDPKIMQSRVIFGFLRKRSRGKFKFFVNRWYFMISSRPLNMEDFITDEEVLPEAVLPPMIEFDTIHYYYMDG
jgi:hypothetical protein